MQDLGDHRAGLVKGGKQVRPVGDQAAGPSNLGEDGGDRDATGEGEVGNELGIGTEEWRGQDDHGVGPQPRRRVESALDVADRRDIDDLKLDLQPAGGSLHRN